VAEGLLGGVGDDPESDGKALKPRAAVPGTSEKNLLQDWDSKTSERTAVHGRERRGGRKVRVTSYATGIKVQP